MLTARRVTKLSHLYFLSRRLSSYILGIETSCDDTGVAIVNGDGKLIADVTKSQLPIHLRNGGVIPTFAKNLHNENLENAVIESLEKAKLNMRDMSAIAITTKPGMPLSLEVGVEFAKKLCLHYDKPMIPIHHMEAHALIGSFFKKDLSYPFLTLLISGGHSLIALVKDLDKFYLLGTCLDDAPGEVLDKIARRLKVKNFGPPFDSIHGGQAIEILARSGNPTRKFVEDFAPLHKHRTCDFSFTGFKNYTKFIKKFEREHDLPPDQPVPEICDISFNILVEMSEHFLTRLQRSLEFIERSKLLEVDEDDEEKLGEILLENVSGSMMIDHPIKLPLVVSGGVACNDFITNTIKSFCETYSGVYKDSQVIPIIPRPKKLCTDNGIMIAWNGLLKYRQNDILSRREDIELVERAATSKELILGISLRSTVKKADIKVRKARIDRKQQLLSSRSRKTSSFQNP